MPKWQNFAQSGHTARLLSLTIYSLNFQFGPWLWSTGQRVNFVLQVQVNSEYFCCSKRRNKGRDRTTLIKTTSSVCLSILSISVSLAAVQTEVSVALLSVFPDWAIHRHLVNFLKPVVTVYFEQIFVTFLAIWQKFTLLLKTSWANFGPNFTYRHCATFYSNFWSPNVVFSLSVFTTSL